jgi:hypothetical protein
MSLKRIWIMPLVVGFLLLPALAITVPAPDIDGLTEKSDFIVLGEAILVERDQAAVDHVTLRIDEVVRGVPLTPLKFDAFVPSQDGLGFEQASFKTESYGLFFLRNGTNGTTLADRYYGYIPVPHGLHSHGDTPLDRIVSLLADMLILPNNRRVNLDALMYLRESKSRAANAALHVGLNTTADSDLQMGIASGLLLQGDASTLTFIKQQFLTGPKRQIDPAYEVIIGNVMASNLNDARAIPDLQELLSAPSVSIRRGAAGALRRSDSASAIAGLLKALDDSDSIVRLFAARGLAHITKQTNWSPSETDFKNEESKYLGHWREWAHNR